MNHPDIDDMPVLMSSPNADAPTLTGLELGDDAIRIELTYPEGPVGMLTLGFKGTVHPYQLDEVHYTLPAAPCGEMFGFAARYKDGKRYRWYVHDEAPGKTFALISDHIRPKVPL